MSKLKCVKPAGLQPTETDRKIIHAFLAIQKNSTDLGKEIEHLYFIAAKEVKVPGGKTAIVIFIPFRQLSQYRKVQVRLIREFEKKLNGKHVLIVAQRKTIKKIKKTNRIKQQKRPRSRTVTAVNDAILEDIVYPYDIVGKRLRIRLDTSRLLKVFLNRNDKPNVEYKLDTLAHVYHKLTGRSIQFTFPPKEAEVNFSFRNKVKDTKEKQFGIAQHGPYKPTKATKTAVKKPKLSATALALRKIALKKKRALINKRNAVANAQKRAKAVQAAKKAARLSTKGKTSTKGRVSTKVTKKDAKTAKVSKVAKDAKVAKTAKVAKDAKVAKTAKVAKVAKVGKPPKPAPAKDAKVAKAAKPAKVAKDAKAAKTAKVVKDAKVAKSAKPAKVAKDAKVAKTAKTAKVAKDAKVAKTAKVAKDAKVAKTAKVAKDAKVAKAAKPAKVAKDAKVAKPAKTAAPKKEAKSAKPAKVSSPKTAKAAKSSKAAAPAKSKK